MKKIFLNYFIVMLVTIIATSCGGAVEPEPSKEYVTSISEIQGDWVAYTKYGGEVKLSFQGNNFVEDWGGSTTVRSGVFELKNNKIYFNCTVGSETFFNGSPIYFSANCLCLEYTKTVYYFRRK